MRYVNNEIFDMGVLFKLLQVGWLVSLFNVIPTFVGYLMPNPFL